MIRQPLTKYKKASIKKQHDQNTLKNFLNFLKIPTHYYCKFSIVEIFNIRKI